MILPGPVQQGLEEPCEPKGIMSKKIFEEIKTSPNGFIIIKLKMLPLMSLHIIVIFWNAFEKKY